MRTLKLIPILLLIALCNSCDYLDVVPDNVATIDNAFTMQSQAQKYLATCYSYLPPSGSPESNVAFLGGDECWAVYELGNYDKNSLEIARGFQGKSSPRLNFWDGENGSVSLFKALRDCNIFLENVSDLTKVRDITPDLRQRWLGEVEFLKAYYHFYLLRMYGPIPIIDKNFPVSAKPEEVRVKRMPVDSVVNYISNLLDSAAAKLPPTILNPYSELGRITKPIALSIKARLLVMAASPLFNGNNDYSGFKDNDGMLLFNPNYEISKWQRAADACKKAIDCCKNEAGLKLYEFPGTLAKLSDTTLLQMSIRNSVTEKWNSEIIWGLTNSQTDRLQRECMVHLDQTLYSSNGIFTRFGATMKMAELFYSKNGVPIKEDKTLNFNDKNQLRTATDDEQYYMMKGYQTARINYDREPRFYADMAFDGSIWYMHNSPSDKYNGDPKQSVWSLKAEYFNESSWEGNIGNLCVTGYAVKKLVNWNLVFVQQNQVTVEPYPWPEIRLSDLYLLYAEALNEAQGPSSVVYDYLNEIRARAGIPTVQTAWANYSSSPTKYTTQDGLRSIIHQERLIEMAFEGSRFWDLRRWKEAAITMIQPITGWDINQKDPSFYYRTTFIYDQQFVAPRDYFWPIKEWNLLVNRNLVQNPGW